MKKAFKISSLFDIHPTSAYKLTNAALYQKNGKVPVVSNSSENHGRSGFSNLEPTESDIITFSDTGTKSPDSFFYQEGKFIGYPHVQGMYPYSDKWSKKSLMYLITLLKVNTQGKYDYSTKMTRNDILNMSVNLPVTKKGEIDFTFMENYITNIEKEYSLLISNILETLNLDKFDLTKDELRALDLSNKRLIKYKKYQIHQIFEKIETKNLKIKVSEAKKEADNIYNLPALTAGIINQGLSCYVPRDNATVLKNVISVSANGANTGKMFYQPYEFTVLQDSYALKYIGKDLSEDEYLYMTTALQKCVEYGYDWTNKAGWNKIKDLYIKLPVDAQDNIDLNYMALYISAQKKLVIASLIKSFNI